MEGEGGGGGSAQRQRRHRRERSAPEEKAEGRSAQRRRRRRRERSALKEEEGALSARGGEGGSAQRHALLDGTFLQSKQWSSKLQYKVLSAGHRWSGRGYRRSSPATPNPCQLVSLRPSANPQSLGLSSATLQQLIEVAPSEATELLGINTQRGI